MEHNTQLIEVLAEREQKLQAMYNVLYALIAMYMRAALNKKPYFTPEMRDVVRENMENAIAFAEERGLETAPFKKFLTLAVNGKVTRLLGDDGQDWLLSELRDDHGWTKAVAPKGAIGKDTSLSDADYKLLKALILAIFTSSKNADNYINNPKNKMAANIDKRLLPVLQKETSDQSRVLEELKRLVAKFIKASGDEEAIKTGGNRTRLTYDELNRWKIEERFPKDFARYKELRKLINTAFKIELENYVNSKGGDPQPIHEVKRYFQSHGMEDQLPNGFVGLVDAAGKLYTVDGRKLKNPPTPDSQVIMNDNKEARNVCRYRPPGGKVWQWSYTVEHKKEKVREKHDVGAFLRDNYKQIRAKWHRDLMGNDPKRQVLGLLADIIVRTGARVGTEGNETYGLTTLKKKHIKKKGQGFVLRYVGKAGVRQSHELQPGGEKSTPQYRRVFQLLKELIEKAEPEDRIFRYPDGTAVTARDLNRYLKATTGNPNVTARRIRTMLGTMLAEEALSKSPLLKVKDKSTISDTEAAKEFRKLLTEVGDKLGHRRMIAGEQVVTPATAINAYIDPIVMFDFFKKLGRRVPKSLGDLFDVEGK